MLFFWSKHNPCDSFHSVYLNVGSGSEPFDIPEALRFPPFKENGYSVFLLPQKEKQCFKTDKEPEL